MTLDCDVAILGGGCAGLSLAVELARRAPHRRVSVLEEREHYTRDRTWCFWNTARHAFESCITHQWSGWMLRQGSRTVQRQSRRYSYQHLPADRFYQKAMEVIAAAATHRHVAGVSVSRLIPEADAVCIETSRGMLRAGRVFDSRPAGGPLTRYEAHSSAGERSCFVQRFLGFHVRTDARCFDPGVVSLMDFCPLETRGRTAFFYLLPFARDEALVELTYLDRSTLAPADAEAALRCRLAALTRGYEVLYREQGALPMSAEPMVAPPPDPRVHAIGARGGRIRPSSGYAFLRIQRQSQLLADALGRGVTLPARYEPRAYSLLDRIFLTAMRQNPTAVPGYFMQLFAHVPADTLVRFLSEVSSPLETLRAACALPRAQFATAALTQLAGRLQ